MSARHPNTEHLLDQFGYEHLRTGRLRDVSKKFHDLSRALVEELSDGPELAAGLRKLLEAKDCCVRQSVIDAKAAE